MDSEDSSEGETQQTDHQMIPIEPQVKILINSPSSDDSSLVSVEMPTPGKAPVPPMEVPAASVEAPAAPVETPAVPVETPAALVETPAASVQKPTASAKKPAAPVKRPATPVQKSAAPAKKPATSIQRPTSLVQKPAGPVQKPAASVQRPTSLVQTPAAPVQRPAAPAQRPAALVQTPAALVQTPAAAVDRPLVPIPAQDADEIIVEQVEGPAGAVYQFQQPIDEDDEQPSRVNRQVFDWFYLPEQTPVILFIYFYGHILSLIILLATLYWQLRYETLTSLLFTIVLHFIGLGCCMVAIRGYVERWETWSIPLQWYLIFLEFSLVISFILLITCDRDELLIAYETRPFYNMKLTEFIPSLLRGAEDQTKILAEPMNEVAVQHFRSCFIVISVFVVNLYTFIAVRVGFSAVSRTQESQQGIELQERGGP